MPHCSNCIIRNYLLANTLNDYFVTTTIANSSNRSFEPANVWFDCRQHLIQSTVPFDPARLAAKRADCSRLEVLELAENIIHVAKLSADCSCKRWFQWRLEWRKMNWNISEYFCSRLTANLEMTMSKVLELFPVTSATCCGTWAKFREKGSPSHHRGAHKIYFWISLQWKEKQIQN